jgi:hypothetical protein
MMSLLVSVFPAPDSPETRIAWPQPSLRICLYAASAIAYTWGDRSPSSAPLRAQTAEGEGRGRVVGPVRRCGRFGGAQGARRAPPLWEAAQSDARPLRAAARPRAQRGRPQLPPCLLASPPPLLGLLVPPPRTHRYWSIMWVP